MFRKRTCEEGFHKFAGRWDSVTVTPDEGPIGPGDMTREPREISRFYVGDICVRCGKFVQRDGRLSPPAAE